MALIAAARAYRQRKSALKSAFIRVPFFMRDCPVPSLDSVAYWGYDSFEQ
jgi:hypothetical protein